MLIVCLRVINIFVPIQCMEQIGRYVLSGQDGILLMDGEKWKEHSRALAPIFHGSHVDKHGPAIADIASHHLNRWENGETPEMGVLPSRRKEYGGGEYNQSPFPQGYETANKCAPEENTTGGPDLFTAVQGMVMDFLLLYGFNCSPESSLGVGLASEFYLYRQLLGLPGFFVKFVQMTKCTKKVQKLVEQLVEKHEGQEEGSRTTDGEGKGSIPNFLTRMIESGFGLKEIAAEVNHLYGAYKAIGFVLTCVIWRLSKHPEWTQKLREEWSDKLGKGEADIPTREDLNRLPVTKAVINECLRMHVVSLGVLRQISAPLEIDGKTLPAGTEIMILLHSLHHHPDFWENPSEFNPSRFLEKEPTPYTFIPFLSGARMCAGKQLAELHLVVLLHSIFRLYNVTTSVDELVLKPDNYSTIEGTIPFTVQKIDRE